MAPRETREGKALKREFSKENCNTAIYAFDSTTIPVSFFFSVSGCNKSLENQERETIVFHRINMIMTALALKANVPKLVSIF